MENQVIQGDCLEVMKKLPDNCIDSIVTDPPYHLVSIVKRYGKEGSKEAKIENTDGSFNRLSKGFMGKQWDGVDESGIGIAQNVELWKECLRVLKPGGHLLAFSGTRTYHRMASAIEDAGFEVRDMIEWVYGSGFPKSLNIGKAVDKLQGNEREIVGEQKLMGTARRMKGGNFNDFGGEDTADVVSLTKGTSEWEGWGTALKPAHEPICMARKPLAEKTVAENCLKWGTGGINIDESRVAHQSESDRLSATPQGKVIRNNFAPGEGVEGTETNRPDTSLGRFPANLIHDNSEEVRECFPESNGSGKARKLSRSVKPEQQGWGMNKNEPDEVKLNDADSGNASRFFKSIPIEEVKNCSVVINCSVCGKPKKIRASIKKERNYCSLECSHKGKTLFNSQNVECDYCGTEFTKKNSQMFTDKHFCSRECFGEWQSKFLLGENSYNWKDGKMDLISRVRSLKKMIDWRNEVYKRDNYTCQKCGDNTGGNLEAHHKKHLSDLIRELNLVDITDAIESKELWDIDNGITLCDDCHIETHKTESKKSVLYFAKASKSERNRGCEGLEEGEVVRQGLAGEHNNPTHKNNHPTVKPVALMEYLIKMVTPKDGIVLDPFAGSGTTGLACKNLNRNYILIEKEPEYVDIIKARLKAID